MKVKYILNNAMMGSYFKLLPQDKVISKNRIDPYHTEVILELVNQKQLDNVNRMLFGIYAKGRYKILEEKLISEATTSPSKPSDLYHFMLLNNFRNLVKSEEFFLGPWNNLSLTLNKNLIKNCQHCRLNIDYDKLKEDGYNIEQYDSNTGNDGVDSEEEFRVTVKNSKTIPNFLKYIKDVCIFSSDMLFEIYIDSIFGRQNYIDLMDLCKYKNIKIIEE